MNEADPSPFNLDELRLLPDWLREEGPPPSKQYAAHEGGGTDDSGPRRGSRPGSFDRDRRDSRGFGGSGGDRRRDGARRSGPGPRGGEGRPPREERREAPTGPVVAAPVKVEFLPDEKCLASINKQIRSTHMAYPLFGLARMFLQEPARHWVQFTLLPGGNPAATALYQLGDEGPVTTDRAVLERIAFDTVKDNYYVEQTEQKDPPKGNFTNVARNRLSGTLLGPTNYHGYQPALRADYESRFSRRMSFEDYRRNIEVVSDPALVERWKEDARATTTIATREGEPPTILQSAGDARVHFRQHFFDGLVRMGTTFKVHGSIARDLPEPAMMQAIRHAHETELRYPAQFVQILRQGLQTAGLHIFKHRKRVVYVSIARPVPFAPDGAVSEGVAAILETVEKFPLCTRKILAAHMLARYAGAAGKPAMVEAENELPPVAGQESPAGAEAISASVNEGVEMAAVETTTPAADEPAPAPAQSTVPIDDALGKAKAALAADLRFLVQSGHLIEFHNGTFDLPLPPRAREEQPSIVPPAKSTAQNPGTPAVTPAAPDSGEDAADDAERDALTLASVTILTPPASDNAFPAPPLESGLEKTEADMISQPVAGLDDGVSSTEQHHAVLDPVVVGDVESAHPLSPL